MKIRSVFDATLGRMFLPLRATPETSPGGLWLDGLRCWLRGNDLAQTQLRLLTSVDIGAANGVAGLDAGGKLPASVLPASVVTSGGGGGSGSGGGGGLIGEIRMWFGDVFSVPNGWLVCDGSNIPQAQYGSLFSVIGHRAGRPSNYATHFRLPDFIGRVPVGSLGPNDAAVGRVHKITVVNPGVGFTPGTYTGVALAGAGATVTSAPVVTIVVDAGGTVERIDIEQGGSVSVSPTRTVSGFGTSNCDLIIPSFGGSTVGSALLEYEIALAPISNAAQAWGVRMTNRGAGYTSPPRVTITGGGVIGATAVAILDGDAVREVVITNPGNGSVSGASIAFSGGGAPTTPATASIVFYDAPSTVGDIGGEAAHVQVRAEVGPHNHPAYGSLNGGDSGLTGRNSGNSYTVPDDKIQTNTPAGQPMPWRQPYTGVLYLIYAGA